MNKTFNDLNFEPMVQALGGKQALLFFPNGYGVSVIQTMFSRTRDDSEFELAVLKGSSTNWCLTYDTPITDDVLGYLSAAQITHTMSQIQKL